MSRPFIKICGMTSAEGIAAALDCGVDAVGFVFHAASPRDLAPARAAALARAVPRGVLRVAVTKHPAQSLVDAILAEFAPDVLQTDLEDLAGLVLPAALATLPVLRSRATAAPVRGVVTAAADAHHGSTPPAQAASVGDARPPAAATGRDAPPPLPPAAALPRRFLYEGPVSGSGTTADWATAADLARRGELVLAGGLAPANVGEALARVRPFGVDVSSGVESAPGRKDPALIREFVAQARAAAARVA